MSLKGIKLFSDLSEKDKQNLSLFTQKKFLKQGEKLFLEGDDANAMYFLIEGALEVYKVKNDNKISLGIVNAEGVIGEMSIFGKQSKRMASSEAIKDTILLTVLSFSIKEIAIQYPDLHKKIKNIIKLREEENKKLGL